MPFKVVMIVANRLIPHNEEDYRRIGVEFITLPCQTEDEIIAATQEADAVITMMRPFTRKVIERLSKCKLIYNLGTGYEAIDIRAATEHGIYVSYPGDYCTEEVAEHTMALILACARKLFLLDKAVRDGKWDSYEKKEIRLKILPPMFKLKGQILGLIGFGRIPQRLVPKAKGFELRIIAFDPYVSSSAFETLGVESVSFDYLLKSSDYVSVHAAFTPKAWHMIGIDQFKMMKHTAYIINCARGEFIDEQALYLALTQGYIAGAALDVLERESVGLDHPLLRLENVIITAHSAYYSEQSVLKYRQRPYEEIARIIKGQQPRRLLNPEVKGRFEAVT